MISCRALTLIRIVLTMPKNKGPAFYAVRKGRQTGIFDTWEECEKQVKGYSNPRFKKFQTREEAQAFVSGKDEVCPQSFTPPPKPVGPTAVELESSARSNDSDSAPKPAKRIKTEPSVNTNKDTVTYTDGTAVVYTDGACTGNGKSGAKAGIGVYWGPNHNMNVSERLPGRQTNNRAEIHAAIRAIRQAKQTGHTELTLKTDSEFMINSITKWIDGWKKRGWKLSTGGPVKNKEDFKELDAVMKGIKVNWVHVRGHAGEPGNEAADALAVRGAQMAAWD